MGDYSRTYKRLLQDLTESTVRSLTLTDFILQHSRCFSETLHSLFNPLLNNFTMHEKCY